jgi:lysophospholipase L1-like esterase
MSFGHSFSALTGSAGSRALRFRLLGIVAVLVFVAQTVSAAPVQSYLALGDSLAFGQTTPPLQPSFGDQGYVKPYADWLATRNGGVRPNVINLAISGETSSSFFDGMTPPGGVRRVDANLNYPVVPMSQDALMLSRIASEKALGHQISHVSFALGSNDFLNLATSPAFAMATQAQQTQMVGQTFATLQGNYTHLLTQLRGALPTSSILLLDYYNPYAVDPSNPLSQMYSAIALAHEQMVKAEAAAFHAQVVDIYQPFVGHEAQYTYILQGNIHPNATGYGVIADQMIKASQAPEPGSCVLLGMAALTLGGYCWRRRRPVAVSQSLGC